MPPPSCTAYISLKHEEKQPAREVGGSLSLLPIFLCFYDVEMIAVASSLSSSRLVSCSWLRHFDLSSPWCHGWRDDTSTKIRIMMVGAVVVVVVVV